MKRLLKSGRGLSISAMFALTMLACSVTMAQQPANDPQINEVRAALRSADYQHALSKVNSILAKRPNDVSALCLKGEIQTQMNNVSAALESFEKAIKVKKTSIWASVGKANALGRLKKEDESSTLMRQAISIKPSSAADLLSRGIAFYNLGDDEKAQADYDEALKLDPSFAEAYLNKGIIASTKRDPAEAITLFTTAIKLDPNYADAFAKRGAAYSKKAILNLQLPTIPRPYRSTLTIQ